MKKLSTAILSMLCLAATATEPALIEVGNAVDFTYHVRYNLDGTGHHSVALAWPDEADSARYKAVAEIEVSDFDDPLFPAKTRYTITKTRDDSSSIYKQGDFECRSDRHPAFSMVLRRTSSGAALSLGADRAIATIAVPFNGDSIFAEATEAASISRHSLIIRNIPDRNKASFDNQEALISYLRTSKDPMESIWEYLDRDINTAEARLGGKYTIATILAPDGYDIIYLDGAKNIPGDWSPLDIKGKLTNTAFDGHYDLMWLAAPRHIADSEASATIEVGGEVLELSFPTLRSRLRFRRVKTE